MYQSSFNTQNKYALIPVPLPHPAHVSTNQVRIVSLVLMWRS